jgi:hypothetical protein
MKCHRSGRHLSVIIELFVLPPVTDHKTNLVSPIFRDAVITEDGKFLSLNDYDDENDD